MPPRKKASLLDLDDSDEVRGFVIPAPPEVPPALADIKQFNDASMRKLLEAGAKAVIGEPGNNPRYPAGRHLQRPSSAEGSKATSRSLSSFNLVGSVLASRVAAATGAASSSAFSKADERSRAAPT